MTKNNKKGPNKLSGLPVQPNGLTEKSMSDAFGQELFPQDGRNSTERKQEPKPALISVEDSEVLSEYTIRSSHTPSR